MQTTRGTSLTQPPDNTIGRPGRSRVRLVLFIALLIIGLDQATKAIALATLADRAPIELLGGLLTLRLVRNPGAAFGMAQGFTVLLTIVAAGVIVVIIRVARRLTSLPWSIALSLLLGGAVGNLIDRLFRPPGVLKGHVTDFLQLPHWPVFNVADSAIVCAGVLMVILTFRGIPLTSTDSEPKADPDPAVPEGSVGPTTDPVGDQSDRPRPDVGD